LRKLCAKSQLLLFITPEYNSSVSASVKNAYDWLSRPDADYDNKPVVGGKSAGIMSTSWVGQTQAKDC
jgi:NAD(P)H-dependent FMN reductase